jgi:hypothetical protein
LSSTQTISVNVPPVSMPIRRLALLVMVTLLISLLTVGWAKARSAVPTHCVRPGIRVGFASLRPPYGLHEFRKVSPIYSPKGP